MIRIALALILLAPQDDAAVARGQKYLEKMAEAWAAKPPEELTIGLYVGSKWVGSAKLSVKPATKDFAAFFEANFEAQFVFGEKKMKHHATLCLSETFAIVSYESKEDDEGKVTKKRISVKNGHWTQTTDKEGKTTTEEGDLKPALIHDDILPGLLFYAVPDATESVQFDVIAEKREYRFHKLKEKKPLTLGAKSVDCTAIEWWDSKEKKDVSTLYVGEDGKLQQISLSGETMRMRAVKGSEIGKDLDEKRSLADPGKVVIALFTAIKKMDKDAIDGLFDWERMSQEMVTGYASMTEEQQKATQKDMRARLIEKYTDGEMAKNLPDPEDLEKLLGAMLKVTEKDGKADVDIAGSVFRLYKVESGDRKGKWVIYAVKK